MDARTLTISQVFGQSRRYLVPLFQRPYVWTRENHWEPLWEDVLGTVDRYRARQEKAPRPHFLGAVVLDQVRTQTGTVDARLVVDGQQRLTTLQILLHA